MTIKEYASKNGVTIQAVYQQINRKSNKEFLKEHIEIVNGIKHLDEVAVEYLESKHENSPTVIIDTNEKDRIDELENENHNLLLKVAQLQEALLKEKDQVKLLQQEKISLFEKNQLLLEERQSELEEKVNRSFFSRFFSK